MKEVRGSSLTHGFRPPGRVGQFFPGLGNALIDDLRSKVLLETVEAAEHPLLLGGLIGQLRLDSFVSVQRGIELQVLVLHELRDLLPMQFETGHPTRRGRCSNSPTTDPCTSRQGAGACSTHLPVPSLLFLEVRVNLARFDPRS